MTTLTKTLPALGVISAATLMIVRLAKAATPPRIPHWTEYLRETRDNS
ncbi:hypothetical protein [Roseovarius sp. EL26]|nr:hypothetical protein [Roseovarius sp. EL26]